MSSKNYLAKYAKSFNWAGFFLPKDTYKKCSALYDFCRVADNIADENNTIETKIEKFKKFRGSFENKNFNDIIIQNIWSLILEYNISIKIVYDLLDGINSDIRKEVKLNTKKELLIYSYRVAGTVGLMMAKILKVNKKNSLKSAIDLGIAMQLTNISRDVIEDSKNNRFYISENFEVIKSTIKLADVFYENSFYSIKEIPMNLRFSILIARRIYRKIGYKILDKKNLKSYRNAGKIYVSNLEKTLETFLSILDFIKLSLTHRKDDQIIHDHILINEVINLNERI